MQILFQPAEGAVLCGVFVLAFAGSETHI